MAVIIVSYDLNSPGQNYTELYDALEEFEHCHELDSTWLLDTNLTPAQVRDRLTPHMDSNDAIFVAKLQRNWGSRGYKCATWLKDKARTW